MATKIDEELVEKIIKQIINENKSLSIRTLRL